MRSNIKRDNIKDTKLSAVRYEENKVKIKQHAD